MKQTLIALLATLAITATAAPYAYDTQTGAWHASRTSLPQSRGQVSSLRTASSETLAAVGIISPCVDDPTPEGMVRVGWQPTPAVIDGIAHRIPVCITQAEHDAAQAAQQAAQDAAEAERRAAPIVYEQSIETPSIILPSDSQGIGYEIFAADDGTLLKIVAHASPLKTKAERDALKQAVLAAHYAAKTASKAKSDAVKTKGAKIKKAEDLLPIIEALQAQIDALTGGGQ